MNSCSLFRLWILDQNSGKITKIFCLKLVSFFDYNLFIRIRQMISNRNGYLFQMIIFQFFADLFSRTFPKDQKCLFMVCNYMDKILTSSMHAENLRILPAFSKLCRKIDYR